MRASAASCYGTNPLRIDATDTRQVLMELGASSVDASRVGVFSTARLRSRSRRRRKPTSRACDVEKGLSLAREQRCQSLLETRGAMVRDMIGS